eukprot:scaffold3031_cov102-Cylindrotheca_fusiformis.AAC.3
MELYNDSVVNASVSWKEDVKSIPDYRTLIGELLFREIFSQRPGAISLFGFGKGVDERNLPETLFKLPAFKRHTVGVVARLESAMSMMAGNNMETLAGSLSDLGFRHVVYGVQPSHYLIVESALVRTLEHVLRDKWTPSIKKDWAAVFKFITRTMMLGAEHRVEIVKATRRDTEHKKVATLRIKAIPRSKRTGVLSLHSRCSATSRFEGDNRQTPGRTSSSEPPKPPSRGSLSSGSLSSEEFILGELYDDEDDTPDAIVFNIGTSPARTTSSSPVKKTISSTSRKSTIRSMMSGEGDYWLWGDSSIEPPKVPKRRRSIYLDRTEDEDEPPNMRMPSSWMTPARGRHNSAKAPRRLSPRVKTPRRLSSFIQQRLVSTMTQPRYDPMLMDSFPTAMPPEASNILVRNKAQDKAPISPKRKPSSVKRAKVPSMPSLEKAPISRKRSPRSVDKAPLSPKRSPTQSPPALDKAPVSPKRSPSPPPML